jgi:hypothetical protein
VLGEAVRDAIKDQLRESVKAHLGKSFKAAFDSSLVPAFQVGTAVLHNKLQSTFVQAAEALSEISKRSDNSGVQFEALQQEVLKLLLLLFSLLQQSFFLTRVNPCVLISSPPSVSP